jgi:hypothetical protein
MLRHLPLLLALWHVPRCFLLPLQRSPCLTLSAGLLQPLLRLRKLITTMLLLLLLLGLYHSCRLLLLLLLLWLLVEHQNLLLLLLGGGVAHQLLISSCGSNLTHSGSCSCCGCCCYGLHVAHCILAHLSTVGHIWQVNEACF